MSALLRSVREHDMIEARLRAVSRQGAASSPASPALSTASLDSYAPHTAEGRHEQLLWGSSPIVSSPVRAMLAAAVASDVAEALSALRGDRPDWHNPFLHEDGEAACCEHEQFVALRGEVEHLRAEAAYQKSVVAKLRCALLEAREALDDSCESLGLV